MASFTPSLPHQPFISAYFPPSSYSLNQMKEEHIQPHEEPASSALNFLRSTILKYEIGNYDIYNKYTIIRSFFLWGTPLPHNKIRLAGLSSSTIFKWESNTLFKHFLLPLKLNFAPSSSCQSKDCELLLCLRRGWILGVWALASFSTLPIFYRTPITVNRLVSLFSLIHCITRDRMALSLLTPLLLDPILPLPLQWRATPPVTPLLQAPGITFGTC